MHRLRQIAGILRAHPQLIAAVFHRPFAFLNRSEEEMPSDFHVLHARLCLERSIRRYHKVYAGQCFTPSDVLERELIDFPCGRKSLLYVITRLLRPMRVVETGSGSAFPRHRYSRLSTTTAKEGACTVWMPRM
jgi:hypothetical protein